MNKYKKFIVIVMVLMLMSTLVVMAAEKSTSIKAAEVETSNNTLATGTNSGGVYLNPLNVDPISYAKYLCENNLRFNTGDAVVDVSGGTVFANTSVTSGKWYWEVAMLKYTNTTLGVCGVPNDGKYAVINNDDYIICGNLYPFSLKIKAGDIVGILLDADNGKLEFMINGISGLSITLNKETFGNTFTPSLGINNTSTDMRINFGATTFKYLDKIPSGYLPYSCAEPIKLTVNVEDNQAKLSWNAIGGATSYNIKRYTKSGGPYETIISTAETTYTDSNLTKGTTYYYVVSPIGLGKDGQNSNEATVTIDKNLNALLTITYTNSLTRTYDLKITELNNFISWYNNAVKGTADNSYKFAKTPISNNFNQREEYVIFDKISNFDVDEY